MESDKCPSRILNYLYLGGKPHAKSRGLLQQFKINCILNCTPPRSVDPENGCPNFFEKDKSITYKRIPIFDNRGEDIISHMDTAYNFIEQSKHYGAILVHCHKGVSRSASFVIGYLMRKNGFTCDEALAHVQSCRHVVNPNDSFLTQLKRYEKLLREREQLANEEKQKYDLQSSLGGRSKLGSVSTVCGPDIGPSACGPVGPDIGPSACEPVGPDIGPSACGPVGPDTDSYVDVDADIGPNIGPCKEKSIGSINELDRASYTPASMDSTSDIGSEIHPIGRVSAGSKDGVDINSIVGTHSSIGPNIRDPEDYDRNVFKRQKIE